MLDNAPGARDNTTVRPGGKSSIVGMYRDGLPIDLINEAALPREREHPMIIGYQFISEYGYPVGNVQPTFEAAEEAARFDDSGCFYTVNKPDGVDNGPLFLCLVGRKTPVVLG